MIEARALAKHFGAVQAVRNVSFTARDGSITTLLGPNGAGKSTTFRILSTVIAASGGQALIDGLDVADDPLAVRGRIAVLPHDAGIYARLTARENVRYFGALHGLEPGLIEQRFAALVERLDMRDFCDRRTGGFSQGQRVKVALARALIHDPRNIILDEPTNGLDVMATRGLRSIIRDLRDEGRCVLFSSHIMQEVANLCDTLVVIDEGVVKYQGDLEGLKSLTGETDLEEAFIQLIAADATATPVASGG